jgi:cardiolipin synthase A/B
VSARVQAGDLARLRAEGKGALMERQLGVLAAAGDVDLYRGNTARLLVDGPQTFAAMKAAIASARHRVLMESYIVEDVGVAAEFAELLIRKAGEGVRVALMYDSVGSLTSDSAFFQRLQAGGVAVCAFNPVNPLQRPGHWELVQRNHRKTLTVDSDVAYTGGINISNVYADGSFGSGGSGGSGGRSKPGKRDAAAGEEAGGWRDTQVELRGPVVTALGTLFRTSWTAQGCAGSLPPAPPPQQATPGQRVVKVVAGDPKLGVNPTYTTLMAAVGSAARSVQLTMGYFAPGPELVQALCDAAARGVDVQLVLPGKSDVQLVLHAARSYYARLLAAGVQIHEWQGSVMHAKTAVVDGVLSSVGSSNLDWRSILLNNEIDVMVLGDDFGQEMEALFAKDAGASKRVDAAAWAQRGMGQRLLESIGRLVEPLL